MEKKLIIKIMGIGIVILFAAASVLPIIGGKKFLKMKY
jgi:hypothetical protein